MNTKKNGKTHYYVFPKFYLPSTIVGSFSDTVFTPPELSSPLGVSEPDFFSGSEDVISSLAGGVGTIGGETGSSSHSLITL
ncbi:hypothetical protein COD76_11660 [Bacillus cereus]|nr:hypothetical protein COL80_15775 [Bacillus thuringiensis]PGU82143.1 hypothetical protein COD76_11660 [Bacillus cereus]